MSPIQNVKKGLFGDHLGAFWIFMYEMTKSTSANIDYY
jgi:hypothetical protein